jgi:hypothetical protein
VGIRKSQQAEAIPIRPPATTPQDRENQLISAAMDLAERQILGGTASAQVITHYLKLGSSREHLEKYKITMENKLLDAKREMLESQQRSEELFGEALKAMSLYQGKTSVDDEDEFDDFDN